MSARTTYDLTIYHRQYNRPRTQHATSQMQRSTTQPISAKGGTDRPRPESRLLTSPVHTAPRSTKTAMSARATLDRLPVFPTHGHQQWASSATGPTTTKEPSARPPSTHLPTSCIRAPTTRAVARARESPPQPTYNGHRHPPKTACSTNRPLTE